MERGIPTFKTLECLRVDFRLASTSRWHLTDHTIVVVKNENMQVCDISPIDERKVGGMTTTESDLPKGLVVAAPLLGAPSCIDPHPWK